MQPQSSDKARKDKTTHHWGTGLYSILVRRAWLFILERDVPTASKGDYMGMAQLPAARRSLLSNFKGRRAEVHTWGTMPVLEKRLGEVFHCPGLLRATQRWFVPPRTRHPS